MYSFSSASKQKLKSCHPLLRKIAKELIKIIDVKVLCCYRDASEQETAYSLGHSKLQYPHSKHNVKPSLAIDIAPYPLDWDDIGSFERMCGIIEGIAHCHEIKIRLGRDFKFCKDYVHIELISE
jgi:peptidoglycan L-alanyl-D-glutamate endopeptidase CwlK